MPAKCNKVKNPCKICLETVNNKSGLQCQGACKKWVHFTCLNYTPGKIKDIKQGIIKVTCPCPDCTTVAPKEYRTDEPFSCTNIQCPSNMPRSCISNSCPSNQNVGGALRLCEKDTCKHNKTREGGGHPCPPPPPPPPPSCPPPPCPPPPLKASSSSGSSCCKKGGDMGNHSSNPGAQQALTVVKKICNTVGELSDQMNCLMSQMKNMISDCPPKPPKDNCHQPDGSDEEEKKRKYCNCPGNPRRG